MLPPRLHTSLKYLCAALLVALHAIASNGISIRIRNLGEVNGHLYRGAQPTPDALRDLAKAHVSLVIDLREPGRETETERRGLQRFGIKYVNVPLPPLSAPSSAEIRRVLSLIVPEDGGTVFVHCRRGKDRTGTVIACYRIQHDGWSRARALSEANSYGMSHAEIGMRSFILKFSPIDLPRPLATGN